MELSTYFRINAANTGQFERTLIVADDDSYVSYLEEDGYQAALQSQQRREIKIKRYARVLEGHILDFKPGKRRRS